MLYSYDIFDTVITRRTATPRGIFAIMRDRLLTEARYSDIPEYLKKNFYTIRITSEELAGEKLNSSDDEDIAIDEIYEIIGKSCGLKQVDRDRLISLECEIEKEYMAVIPERIKDVLEHISLGERVVFISDMYLREHMIREILVSLDERLADIPIYVSSEFKRRKDTGGLFLAVKECEKADPANWIHTGDNEKSDIEIPASMGITAKKADGKELLPFERNLIGKYEDDAYIQQLIGNSTYARQCGGTSAGSNRLAFCYGTSILPMIMDGYINWVLEECIKQGIKNLYFIARDGYLLKQMADYLIEEKNYSIRTKYIFGSRFTWRVPALSDKNWIIKKLCRSSDSSKYLCANDMSRIFGMDDQDFCSFLPDFLDPRVILGSPGKRYVAECLEKNNDFKDFILRNKADDRKKMKDYLEQEIDRKEPFAFVELYGGGFTQYQVAVVLNELGVKKTQNFYYHLTRDFSDDICSFQTYLPMGKKETALVERFFSAPHGRTVGYAYDETGRISPLMDDESENLSDYGHRDIRGGFDAYLAFGKNITGRPNLSIIEEFERFIKEEPDEGLLNFLAQMPVDATDNIEDLCVFAPRINREELREIYQIRAFEPIWAFYSGLNYPYSCMRMSDEDREWIKEISKEKRSPEVEEERNKRLAARGLKRNYLWQYGFMPKIKGKKIALYGAGRFGGFIKEELDEMLDIELSVWVDKNPKECKSGDESIKSVEALFDSKYDFILVAIINPVTIREASNMLRLMGIEEKKILIPQNY